MYLARFSYDVLPVNRQRAIDFILREVKAARSDGLNARLLVPLTRHHDSAALQFELELARLDQLDQFRERGVGTGERLGGIVLWQRGGDADGNPFHCKFSLLGFIPIRWCRVAWM